MNFCTNTLSINASQIQQMLIVVLLTGTPLFVFFAWLSDKWGRKWIMLTGMLLGGLLYIPIYKQIAEQANWKSWQEKEQVVALSEAQINAQSGDSVIVNKYTYANTTVRTEKIEKKKADNYALAKTTNSLMLPASNIRTLGFLIFLQLLFVTMAYGPIAAFLVELFPVQIRYTSMSLPYHIGNGVFGGLTPLIAESLVLKTGNMFAGLYYPVTVALITVLIGALFIKERKTTSPPATLQKRGEP